MKNALSIYLEGWHHRNDIQVTSDEVERGMKAIPRQTEEVLELLDRCHRKATFFVLGEVANSFPSLIRRIHASGHEIASHGHRHSLVYQTSPLQFKEDLRASLRCLEELTGQRVRGYSAPSWSLKSDMRWAFETLESEGITYDASLFPMKTFLYGEEGLPRLPYRIPGTALTEIPPSTVRWFGRNWPFSGGFYLRMLPGSVIFQCLKRLNQREEPGSLYLHPWELGCTNVYLPVWKKEELIPFGRLGDVRKKVALLLREFQFSSIQDLLTEVAGC